MKLQVLIATMHQNDHSLLEKMNIQSDAIVGNQCNQNSVQNFKWKDYQISYLNFAERGVGLNRNNALMRATADYCLFADDDMIYENGYPEIVFEAFKNIPDADAIIFNVYGRENSKIVKTTQIGWLNYMRYGIVRVAVKLSSIRLNGIYFNQCFGGGATYSHGEDTLFLTDCLKHKLKIYAVPQYIAALSEDRESTWFHGYDDKYLKDQGILYRVISPRWWKCLCCQDALRHHKKYGRSFISTWKHMIKL